MRLRYTRPALADLDAILDYISIHSPHGAARIRGRIQAITQLILLHPHIGARTDDPVIRRVAALPYPFLIFYEIAGNDIIVHAIRHGARNPSTMPGASPDKDNK